jgi:hypothetical protein
VEAVQPRPRDDNIGESKKLGKRGNDGGKLKKAAKL